MSGWSPTSLENSVGVQISFPLCCLIQLSGPDTLDRGLSVNSGV